jgi:hypothetical protein
MEELNDKLRSCLMERLSLTKERVGLIIQETDIINPRMYVECISRMEAVKSRLESLSSEIPRLTLELRVSAMALSEDQSMVPVVLSDDPQT